MNRSECLHEIITFGPKKKQAFSEIIQYEFDSEKELIEINKSIFIDVLNKYLQDIISTADLEEWANFIEGRDDINYEMINEYIYSLANPLLTEDNSKNKIKKIVIELNSI